LPTTLRVVLLKTCRKVADRIAQRPFSRSRPCGLGCGGRQTGCAYPGDEELDELLAVMQQRRGTRLFNAAVATHARIRRITRAAQKRWTARQHTYLPALIAESQTGQVANLTISNIISTANDWPAWNG
jgi:hypothetical protein